jgi:DNA-binding transcriptional regulator/RsmH inhibitor MraZ
VNTNDQRHKGNHAYKVDPKYRISILTSWRPEPGGNLNLQLSSDHGLPMIKVLDEVAYSELVNRVKSSDKTQREQGETLRLLAMSVREVTLNDQGKLLIPKDLSEKAGIAPESTVILAGCGIHFEVWSKDNFDKLMEITSTEHQADDLGIF